MNFSKEDFDKFKKVYDPKEFFIILLICCMFICPAYQIYHEGILDDVYLKTPGVVLNKKHMNVDGGHLYSITFVDVERKHVVKEEKVEAYEYFTTKIGDNYIYKYENPEVSKVMLNIALFEYGVLLLFACLFFLALGN